MGFDDGEIVGLDDDGSADGEFDVGLIDVGSTDGEIDNLDAVG